MASSKLPKKQNKFNYHSPGRNPRGFFLQEKTSLLNGGEVVILNLDEKDTFLT